MELKRTCDICGRQYKLIPMKTKGIDEWAIGMDTSHIRIRVREDDTTTLLDFDVCPHCATELIWDIKTRKRNATKKCHFCEHDFGPNHPDYRKSCQGCSNYCNFQLKERMSETQRLAWTFYNGDL